MAETPAPKTKKSTQVPLAEYLKLKEKRAKSKLQLHFPPLVLFIIAIPAAYVIFMVVYFLVSLRFMPQH